MVGGMVSDLFGRCWQGVSRPLVVYKLFYVELPNSSQGQLHLETRIRVMCPFMNLTVERYILALIPEAQDIIFHLWD